MNRQTLNFFGLSDIGLHRPNNQDYWAAWPEIGLFALADGMGGRNGGEIAAKEAVCTLGHSMQQLFAAQKSKINLSDELLAAIQQANAWVYKMGSEIKPLFGMGTTLACLLWIQGVAIYAHVGDSRIYRLRKKKLELLTRDHSLLERWLVKKRTTPPSPPKNIITQAIGTKKRVQPELGTCKTEKNDLFLLCSDGLSDTVSLEEIEKILLTSPNQTIAVKKLIESAKNKRSRDNITALIIAEHDAR